MKEDSWYLWTW